MGYDKKKKYATSSIKFTLKDKIFFFFEIRYLDTKYNKYETYYHLSIYFFSYNFIIQLHNMIFTLTSVIF